MNIIPKKMKKSELKKELRQAKQCNENLKRILFYDTWVIERLMRDFAEEFGKDSFWYKTKEIEHRKMISLIRMLDIEDEHYEFIHEMHIREAGG